MQRGWASHQEMTFCFPLEEPVREWSQCSGGSLTTRWPCLSLLIQALLRPIFLQILKFCKLSNSPFYLSQFELGFFCHLQSKEFCCYKTLEFTSSNVLNLQRRKRLTKSHRLLNTQSIFQIKVFPHLFLSISSDQNRGMLSSNPDRVTEYWSWSKYV